VDAPAAAAQVQVLMDPRDDVHVTKTLLERHDPARGLVVVHPTPNTWAPAAFGHDLLAAFGRAVNRLGEENLVSTTRAWQAATAWMITDRITELVVLRADRLSPGTWTRILELVRATHSRVLLVCHTARIPGPLLDTLNGEHHVLVDLPPPTSVPAPTSPPLSTPDRPDQPTQAGTGIPGLENVPARGVAHYRSEAFRRLDPAAFTCLDAVYGSGFEAACSWLGTHPAPAPSPVGCEPVQLFLTELVHNSPSRAHTLAGLRGAQASFLTHGLLLDVPTTGVLMEVLSGPGLNTLPVTAETVAGIRSGVAHPTVAACLVAALFTGIAPRALRFASLLGPAEDPAGLRVPWRPPTARPPVRNAITRTAPTVATAVVFHVPPVARPLLYAAAKFVLAQPAKSRQRLLAPPAATPERIEAAAGNCGITLPPLPEDLMAPWQLRVTCRPLDAPPVHPASTDPAGPLSSPRVPDSTEPVSTRGHPRHGEHATEQDDDRYGRRPLTIETATGLLHLIHDDRNAIPRYNRASTAIAGRSWQLIRRQLALYARDTAGEVIALAPHPDVLFALRLADRPAAPVAQEPFTFTRHDDR
jgi:hypothetical protein